MIEGRIKSLDVINRRAVITTPEAQDVTVTFPEGAGALQISKWKWRHTMPMGSAPVHPWCR